MTYDFRDKVALVTGASRGIGRGIALEFARNGADIVGVFIKSREKADSALREIRELGVNAEFIQADVSDEAEVNRLRDMVLKRFGKVDFIINNAGIHQHLKTWQLSVEDWDRVLSTNLRSQFLVTRAFTPHMMERKSGRVVNISSCVVFEGTDHEAHYAASKAGTIGLTKAQALEFAPYGINANAVAPGYITTDMLVFDSGLQERKALLKIPKGRFGRPEDIAKMTAFLCSEGADYITGQTFHVNGGLVMP